MTTTRKTRAADRSGDRSSRRAARRTTKAVPVRITTAAPSAAVDLARRRRQYVVSMTARSLCFVGAVVAGPGVLRWVLIAAAVLLPSIAVVAANAAAPRKPGSDLQPGSSGRPELTG